MPSTSGSVAPAFAAVRAAFEEIHARGWDAGSSFAAYHRGELVASLFGGVRDREAAVPVVYDEATLQLVSSSTKFAESLTIALLVERGLLRYDDRLVEHWPEFAAGGGGKPLVTVRQLMMHRAGLPVIDRKLKEAEIRDADRLSEVLEAQPQIAELFRPEPAGGDWRHQDPPPPQAYHGITRGLFASQLVRRVDPQRRTLGRYFHDEIAVPLGLDFWIGLPESERPRLAASHLDFELMQKVATGIGDDLDPDDPRHQPFDYEREFLTELLTQPDSLPHRTLTFLAPDDPKQLLACELPSSTGVGTAKALARMAALVGAGGDLFGQRLFAGRETLAGALECADRYAVDGCMKTEVDFTQGGFGRLPAHDEARTVTFGWGGAGGSMVRFVPELDLAVGYVTNTLGARMAMNDPRPNALLEAAIRCARESAG